MRSLIIAAGLCLATTSANAEIVSQSNAKLTLSNGCVYAQSTSGLANAWSLNHKIGATSARCAQVVHTHTQVVARAQHQSAPFAVQSVERFEQAYVVGVFR